MVKILETAGIGLVIAASMCMQASAGTAFPLLKEKHDSIAVVTEGGVSEYGAAGVTLYVYVDDDQPLDFENLTITSESGARIITVGEDGGAESMVACSQGTEVGLEGVDRVYVIADDGTAFSITGEAADASGSNIAVLSDSMTAYQGYIPEGYWTNYPYGDTDSVSDMWWHRLAAKLGAGVTAVNASSGSGTLGMYMKEGEEGETGADRADDLGRLGTDPDVIFIWFGVNDYFNGADTADIKAAYLSMVEEAEAEYPGSRIYLMQYYEAIYDEIRDVNGLIAEVGAETGLTVLDMGESGINPGTLDGFTFDMFHENAEGSEAMAKYIAETIAGTEG